MKKTVSFFTLALGLATLCSTSFAQITLTNASFPAAGDTLHTTNDFNLPASISLGNGGANQTWNFSALNVDFVRNVAIRPAAESQNASFYPTANLYSPLLNDNAEEYIKSSATKYEYLGYAGDDPIGIGVQIKVRSNPTNVQRVAPLTFKAKRTNNFSFLIPFSSDILPDSLLAGLPIQPDSLRIKFATIEIDTVDSWGTMTIPGGSFSVLRERRIAYNDTKLEAKLPLFGWSDVTNLVGGVGGFGDFFGKDTTATYYFWSNTAKEPIAVVDVNKDTLSQIESIEFKVIDYNTSSADVLGGRMDVSVSPNPTAEVANFSFHNFEAGNYTLAIYDVVGRLMMTKSYYFSGGSEVIAENVARLPTGSYFYRVANEKNKIILTKKFSKQ